MSNRTIRIVLAGLQICRWSAVVAICWSLWILVGAMFAWPSALPAQSISEAAGALRATGELAEAMPLDVTRLALQVAIVAILGLLVMAAAIVKLSNKYAAKLCCMDNEIVLAILRDKFHQAFKLAWEKWREEMNR